MHAARGKRENTVEKLRVAYILSLRRMAEETVLTEGTPKRTSGKEYGSRTAAARKAGLLPHMRCYPRYAKVASHAAESDLSGFPVGTADPRTKLTGAHSSVFRALFR